MLIVDAHLDLSWNALGWNRNLLDSVYTIRAEEGRMPGKGRAQNTVALPEMRRGRVAISFATMLARSTGTAMPHLDYGSQAQAYGMAQGQLAYYRALERDGHIRILVDKAGLTSHIQEWEAWEDHDGDANNAPPLGFLLYNPIAVVITLAHAWAAFAILPIYVSLAKIDRSLLEAATDLGDGPLARFLRVTLPLSMPGVIAASLLVFIPTVGDYVTPKLVGGTTGLMIGNIIQIMFGPANNWPSGAAMAVSSMITIGLSVIVIVWFARKMTRRVA